MPSHDTFSRLFRLLDPAALAGCFSRFVEVLGEAGGGVVAIDGKTLRRSFDRAAGASALHVVTAFATEAQLVLGQKGVPGGGNEIGAARELLRLLDLKGVLVTADAIHCQRETAEIVLERGGDYLFALKANRPAVLADVEAFFDDPPPDTVEAFVTTDADHGRIETRRHAVATTSPGCSPIGGIRTSRSCRDWQHRHGRGRRRTQRQTSISRRYYLSSAKLSAQSFARAVRAHWGIENGLHWVLDVTFDEDRARNRKDHGPENLTVIRKLALNVLRRARPDISIRRKRKRSGWSDAFARSILGQMR